MSWFNTSTGHGLLGMTGRGLSFSKQSTESRAPHYDPPRGVRGGPVSQAAISSLRGLFKRPYKKAASKRSEDSMPMSQVGSASGLVKLKLTDSTFANTPLLGLLEAEIPQVAPKRYHTYKLFPSQSSDLPRIISPIYGVDVLSRDISEEDFPVVLSRLRNHSFEYRNDYQRKSPLPEGLNTSLRRDSSDQAPTSVWPPYQCYPRPPEQEDDNPELWELIGHKQPGPRKNGKEPMRDNEKLNYRGAPVDTFTEPPRSIGHRFAPEGCLRLRTAEAKRSHPRLAEINTNVPASLAKDENYKTQCQVASHIRARNNFEYYRQKILQSA